MCASAQGPNAPAGTQPTGGKGLTIGMALVGAALYSVLHLVLSAAILASAMADDADDIVMLTLGSIALLGVGLVAGIGLILIKRPWSRDLGPGLLITCLPRWAGSTIMAMNISPL